jgi:outer membrane biosynthesis protein TonB
MKILDIISEDNTLNEGSIANWFKRPFADMLERRAAAQIVKEIEKKYATDLAKQTACKNLSEQYGKYLAERELAGQTPIPLERLILKQKEYAGTSFATDREFIDLTTRLAQVKKTQYLKDGARAGEEAGKAGAKTGSSTDVAATEAAVKDIEKQKGMVGDTVRLVRNWGVGVLGLAGLVEIERDYDTDMKTIEAQFATEELGEDAVYFPQVKQEGTPVSSVEQYAYYIEETTGKQHAFVYETKLQRLRAWKAWRESKARLTKFTRIAAYLVAWGVGAGTLWPLSKLKWLKELAKKIDVSNSAGPIKTGLSMTAQALIATLNTAGAAWFAREMGSEKMNDAIRQIIWNDLSSYYPAAGKIWDAAGASTMGHTAAIGLFVWAGNKALELTGLGTKPRTTTNEPPETSNVPSANPMDQDPTTKKKPIDQSDSTENPVEKEKETPVVKPVEKEKEAPKPRPEDNTPYGRGQKFSAAKEAGESTVVINGKTYNTADFKDDGKYWTNPATGESFLKN